MNFHYFTTLLLGSLLGANVAAQAQFTEKYNAQKFAKEFGWAEVALTNGETLKGPVTLYWSEDMLVLNQQGQKVLPSVHVTHFTVRQEQPVDFDTKKRYDFEPMRQGYYPGKAGFPTEPKPQKLWEMPPQVSRVFQTYRWSRAEDHSNFRGLGYFEQLSAGPVVLLSRQALFLKTQHVAGAPGSTGSTYKQIAKKDGFYLSYSDGSLRYLREPEKEFYAAFQNYIPQIQEFARRYNLGFSKPHELAYLVNYANSLAVSGAQKPTE
ncbi:hypothetical protein PK28_09390 [Hymenobacter sp. DG25B]|uniref:hypothetical protein n=1 Tax=Hymenobacter sp. DG25B TaxID=1385664 RepID=UPI0005410FB0|nr:hypothetical protein [Hymenobacter sp. DG25B]AIZ63851.1 hypothetical protein PK28_09390 [Hymenobacter sp. DG25B]